MNAPEPKVSIVVPFYRPGERLRTALASIAASTHRNLEVLMIDDAGRDCSGKIAREFAAADPRFRYLCNAENCRVSRSRNRGIDSASGDYLAFVDSDDRISPEWIAGLLRVAEVQHAEIVIGKSKREWACGEEDYPMTGLSRRGEIPFETVVLKDNAVVWNKLYDAALIRSTQLRFDETLDIGEDLLFNYLAMRAARRIYYSDHGFYYYNAGHPHSVMRDSNAAVRAMNFTRLLILLISYEGQTGSRKNPKVLKKVAKDLLRSHYASGATSVLSPEIRWAIRRIDLFLSERVRLHIWRKALLARFCCGKKFSAGC